MIDLENSDLPHDFGVISMARTADPNTNGSQIFLCLSRARTAMLDGKYVAFGVTVRGADALRELGAVPVQGDRPVDPPMLKSARLVDAPPYGKGPGPVTDPGAAPPPR
jgi:peptidyl-prolyl cis-trans isomerase B (cyclophilin B)